MEKSRGCVSQVYGNPNLGRTVLGGIAFFPCLSIRSDLVDYHQRHCSLRNIKDRLRLKGNSGHVETPKEVLTHSIQAPPGITGKVEKGRKGPDYLKKEEIWESSPIFAWSGNATLVSPGFSTFRGESACRQGNANKVITLHSSQKGISLRKLKVIIIFSSVAVVNGGEAKGGIGVWIKKGKTQSYVEKDMCRAHTRFDSGASAKKNRPKGRGSR